MSFWKYVSIVLTTWGQYTLSWSGSGRIQVLTGLVQGRSRWWGPKLPLWHTFGLIWNNLYCTDLLKSLNILQFAAKTLGGTWIIWHLSCKSLNSSLYHEDSWLALSAVYLLCSPQLSAVLFCWHWEKNNWHNVKSYDKCVFVCVYIYLCMYVLLKSFFKTVTWCWSHSQKVKENCKIWKNMNQFSIIFKYSQIFTSCMRSFQPLLQLCALK